MGESETAPEQAADLRREAEKIYRERAARSPENMANCGSTLQQDVHAIPQDLPTMTGMIHELRVHQIELEMQNSALRQRQEELDAARARYFDLYELAPVGYITVSKQGLIIEANLTAATMLGMVRGGPGHAHSIFSQFIHTEDQDIYYRFRKQLLETGMPQVCEQRMVKKEGPVFLAHLEATVAPDPSTGTLRKGSGQAGQVDEPAIRIVISDITVGQKLKEANIHLESSRYAESIVETVREPLLVLDPDLKIISANHSFYRSFQVDPAETIGSFIYDLGNGQWDIPSLRELLETILPQKTTFDDYEVEHDFTTIGKRTMLLNARQIQGVLGKDRIILLAIEDITELKLKEANNLLEKMVEERTKQLRRESEAPPAEGADTILLVDDDPHILAALNYCLRNTAYEVLTADGGIQALEIMETTKIKVIVSDEQMEGMSGSELLAEVRQRSPHTLRILLTGHATLEMAMRAVNEGGVYRFFTKPWNNALLRLALFAATEKYNFDAERRRLQDVLRQTEEHYRTVVEFSPHAVLVHRDGTIIYANPAAIRMFGATSLQDLTADPFIDRIHPDYHQIVLERLQKIVIERVSTPIIELKYIRLDGTIITVEAQGTPIIFDGLPSIHSAILDITDRKRTEEALQLLRNGLEHLVAERTEELRRTNEELTTEITAHKLTEEALTDQSRELEETNTALHVLLRRREGDLRQSEQKIVANLQKLVLPYIGELKQLRLSPDQSNRVEIIDANLQHVISPFLQNLTARYSTFTPREIQVANLIVEGKTSKEIAVLVNSAHRSVEFHRNNIRKKLGLQGKVTNLRSFLLTLS